MSIRLQTVIHTRSFGWLSKLDWNDSVYIFSIHVESCFYAGEPAPVVVLWFIHTWQQKESRMQNQQPVYPSIHPSILLHLSWFHGCELHIMLFSPTGIRIYCVFTMNISRKCKSYYCEKSMSLLYVPSSLIKYKLSQEPLHS